MTPTDGEMIAVAKRRGIVRLDTGDLVTLVSWGTRAGGRDKGRSRPTNGYARVESQSGKKRWTARKIQIVEVVHPGVDTWVDRADFDDSAGADRRDVDRSAS